MTTTLLYSAELSKGRILSLRLSESGPEFPSELVDALLAGEVVFLCGTGISAPQLPDFKSLVEQTYAHLGIEMDASESRSFDNQRFEEVLGALGRRLADSRAMARSVSEILAVPAAPRLEQHRTVLRLSRDSANRVLTVTTNFDTLLERALEKPGGQVRLQSFSGQSLPSPGGADFSGIIHIHGRLVDPALELVATPLVLTSADYGDAYMRSGWASRFLFDLARCKTIVLIGYSANDAPVRYFLNVLEADRARFPDLRPVYAFDAYEHDPIEAEAGWGTLAVKPLPYCKFNPATGDCDHSLLWGDLQLLADFIERPKRSREERARQILVGNSIMVSDKVLRELTWLFTDRSDLWPIALSAITNPHWFRVLQDNKLWSVQDAAWVISAWIAQNFEDRQRFATAVEWHTIIGRDFVLRLEQRLRQTPPKSTFWLKAWRLLLSVGPTGQAGNFDEKGHALRHKLKSGIVLHGEIAQSVALLAPKLEARRPWQLHDDDQNRSAEAAVEEKAGELRLPSLVALDLHVVDGLDATEIIKALNALDDHAMRILELCSQALCSSLQQMVDIGMIADDYDLSDYSVPSVEEHGQNEHHNGVIFLVRAIVNAFPKAFAINRDRTRAQAAQWRTCPGRMGTRLLLHASRDAIAFSADEALKLLLELNDTDFWIIRREFDLVLRDRARDATPSLREAVEVRIRTSGDAFYSRYPLENDQVDWRVHARDSRVWLRLNMLDVAGVLSQAGRADLDAIVARQPYLDRAVEDQDFFGSYSYGVRDVVGDSGPIIEADPDDRLKVAAQLIQSPDIDQRLGWSSYCHSDPKGAFETLAAAELTAPNIALWNDLLAALAFQNEEKDVPLRNPLAVKALSKLEQLDTQALGPIAASVIDLLRFGPRRLIANLGEWCERLWLVILLGDQVIDYDRNLYETAINSAAGRLAEIILSEFDHAKKTDVANLAQWSPRLGMIARGEGPGSIIGRAVLVQNFAFILFADAELVENNLKPLLAENTDEARALRAVLVSESSITPEVTRAVPDAILRGVVETRSGSVFAAQISSGILRPVLASLRGENPDRWGIGSSEVSGALRKSLRQVRIGALNVLVRWMHADENGAEQAWLDMVAPFFDRVWPKERRFVDNAHNGDLIALTVGSGKHFPNALAKLRPYFSPCAREHVNLYPIKQSPAPEQFPDEVLDLLWLIFGTSRSTSYEMADILDRLVAANSAIEVDRRFQSLEQRAIRYS